MAKKQVDEHVLVFPVDLFHKIGAFQALSFDLNKYLNVIQLNENNKFILKSVAEKDLNYKQLIPYAILTHDKKILTYKRGKQLSEKRLMHKHSIGIGGHISIEDPNLFTTSYEEGMYREIHEELYIDAKYKEHTVALLNDDSDEVGKVHLGIIHMLIMEKPLIRKKEKSINDPKFVSIEFLNKNIDKYENWSRICIENIEKLFSQIGLTSI
ncbi:MAG: phosphoesterase [Bacteroidetes bacterium]|nr:phosphoesterase [Bacteroidota bacterium]